MPLLHSVPFCRSGCVRCTSTIASHGHVAGDPHWQDHQAVLSTVVDAIHMAALHLAPQAGSSLAGALSVSPSQLSQRGFNLSSSVNLICGSKALGERGDHSGS